MSSTDLHRTGRRIPAGAAWRVVAVVLFAAIVVGAASIVIWMARTPDRVRGEGKSYGLASARVSYQLRPDGTVDVVEQITFDFAGSFSGAFRDIPLRAEDSVDEVVVCDAVGGSSLLLEQLNVPDVSGMTPDQARMVMDAYESAFPAMARSNGDGTRCPAGLQPYRPGASTTLGSSGIPGSFGTQIVENPRGDEQRIPRLQRVVWHYGTYGGLREFTIAYRAKGLVRRGGSGNDSDAIVLGVIPWGREWGASLGSLTVHVQLPKTASANVDDVDTWIAARGAARVSSRKITAAADDTLRTIRASAVDITSGEQVDMLVLLPAAASGVAAAKLPTSTEDLDTIRGDADDAVRDNTRRTKRYASLNSHPPGYWPTVATLLGLVLAAAFAWAAWRRTLREDPWPASVPRLLSDPPGELSPALAVSLVEQRLDAAPTALVATVFDLVRRGAYRTLPAQGDAKGARVDIALTRADRSGMEFSKAESKVLALVDAIVAGDPVAMGEFRDKLKRSRSLSTTVAGHQTKFEQHIADEIGWKRWFTRPHSGWITWPLLLGGMLLIVSILLVVWTGLAWSIGSDPRMTMNYGAIGAAFALAMLIVLGMVASARAVMTRYRSDARDEAARWCAYRDFLDSYGDMGDEQTASIEIWERHLVYAIAFGCAEDILSAVRPGAESPETEHGGIGSLSVMPIATFHSFSSGIATRAPQPSSSSGGSFGGGGGFSGGGGGGGGGAW